jgi:prefoldin subunit 5
MVEHQVLSVRLDSLHSDVGEVKNALNRLSDAITKLALIEQTQTQTAEALERAFRSIERIEARLSLIEQHQPKSRETSVWVDRGVTALVCFAAMTIARAMGLL